MELLGILAVCAVVQSLFGVGILVFGTPALLILGFSYEHTLSLLLPCSLCVSALQIREHWGKLQSFRNEFSLWCLPFVALGLGAALLSNSELSLKLAVAILLLFCVACRLSSRLEKWLKAILINHKRIYLAVMGLVHGVSNMGGGLLTVFANTLYDGKETIRGRIAFAYGLMASVQLIVLFGFGKLIWTTQNVMLMVVTVAVYELVGKRAFVRTSNAAYHHLMTVLMACFAALLFASVA